jgi:hypothetical protein
MRLINTSKLCVEEFQDESIPQYAILSHTWGLDEISLQDLQSGILDDSRAECNKIKAFCSQAKGNGFQHVWVDTCCIDKTNSAELSEAINSMYRWYRRAIVCYAYLSDIPSNGSISWTESRWFTRGWTLQELIAPTRVVFFNQDWQELGTRASLSREISDATRIPRDLLLANTDEKYSVAQIFSWAAGRQTTKPEDIAYSLLGLLRVNMAIIYGEGGVQAFIRLQNEVVRQSSDQSVFAWRGEGDDRGPFALSPDEFRDCADISTSTSTEFVMTNRGLKMDLPVFEDHNGVRGAVLSVVDTKAEGLPVVVFLKRTPSGRFRRTRCNELGHFRASAKPETGTVYFATEDPLTFDAGQWTKDTQTYSMAVNVHLGPGCGFELAEEKFTTEGARWEGAESTALALGLKQSGEYGTLLFKRSDAQDRFTVTVGVHNWVVWSDVETEVEEYEELEDVAMDYYSGRYNRPTPTRRDDCVWDGLDRIEKSLSDGTGIKVVVESRAVNGDMRFVVDITVKKPEGSNSAAERLEAEALGDVVGAEF